MNASDQFQEHAERVYDSGMDATSLGQSLRPGLVAAIARELAAVEVETLDDVIAELRHLGFKEDSAAMGRIVFLKSAAPQDARREAQVRALTDEWIQEELRGHEATMRTLAKKVSRLEAAQDAITSTYRKIEEASKP